MTQESRAIQLMSLPDLLEAAADICRTVQQNPRRIRGGSKQWVVRTLFSVLLQHCESLNARAACGPIRAIDRFIAQGTVTLSGELGRRLQQIARRFEALGVEPSGGP